MNASLSAKDGKLVLEVTYNPKSCDWSEAVRADLAAYAIKSHQSVIVIATPRGRQRKISGP